MKTMTANHELDKRKFQKRFAYLTSLRLSLAILNCLLLFSIFNARTPPENEIPQPPNFHQWGAVTLFSGLPSENVRAIAQTPDGVWWFGTSNGLARFDGRRVENLTLEGAASNAILALETDADGALLIGTEDGGGRLFNQKFTPFNETNGKPIRAILTGEMTVLISPDVIFKLHRQAGNSFEITLTDSRDKQFTGVVRQPDGRLFFGSRGHGILTQENGEIFETNTRPRPFFVNVVKSDRAGNLWFGADADESSSGLFFAGDFARPEQTGENLGAVTAIASGENDDLWIGTTKNGLFHFQNRREVGHYTFENTAGALRSNSIYTVFVDREGVIWIGTNRGVCRFDAASPFNRTVSESGNSNFVRALYKSGGGQIYAGTNRGLFIAAQENWREAENFASKTVYNISENYAKQLLVSTSSGLFDPAEKQILAGDVRAAANFQGKTYAAIFGRGVLQIENQTPIFANETPTALFADEQNLWIGTAKDGVFIFDGREIRQEKTLENLRGAAIRKIFRENENTLWFSGERGLYRYANGALQNLISNQDVRDVSMSGADIWAATLKGGLFHLKDDEVFGWLTSAINIEQGLPSEQIFSILPLENHLLIGTNRGIVSYTPSVAAPKIVVTRVLSQRLYNAEEIARPIALDYPQNSLLVEVAGLSSRTFPEQFQYGFLLKNQNGEILSKKLSNDSQFSPAALPSGKYTIEARAYNKDLLASEPLIIEFSVARAPFPLTATALGVLLVAALIGLIWAMTERRRLDFRNRELAAARFDLANEAERERKRIAQDLHDQTLADLRSLMLKSDDAATDPKTFRREIEAVSTEIRRICEDLSPSVLENVGLLPALEFLLSQTIENQQFRAAENLDERINFSANEQMQIYRIAQEVLTNIKHHSDAKFVQMTIDISAENEFILNIEDDGTAFIPQQIAIKGRGIANIKSRAALLKAEIVWRESDAKNTIFELRKHL